MQMFQIDEALGDDTLTMTVRGELDAAAAAQLREALRRVPAGAAVVVDLRTVPFIDSAGLGALICGIRELRTRGGTAALCARRGGVRRLLAVTGFDRIVGVAGSLEDAGDYVRRSTDAAVASLAG